MASPRVVVGNLEQTTKNPYGFLQASQRVFKVERGEKRLSK
jgi:hypothetical protein